jgi:hypothetical protein
MFAVMEGNSPLDGGLKIEYGFVLIPMIYTNNDVPTGNDNHRIHGIS